MSILEWVVCFSANLKQETIRPMSNIAGKIGWFLSPFPSINSF